MLPKIRKPTLQLVFTNEFGSVTDITKDLGGSEMEEVFWAIRYALAGCGFASETINQWFPEE